MVSDQTLPIAPNCRSLSRSVSLPCGGLERYGLQHHSGLHWICCAAQGLMVSLRWQVRPSPSGPVNRASL